MTPGNVPRRRETTIVNLSRKVTVYFAGTATALLAVLIAISLYAFRSFSISAATEHIRTASEIVRVHLTESMINGVIDKRERFLQRLVEVQGLKSARVLRSPEVERQFGKGLALESDADELESSVLRDGKPRFEVVNADGETYFRGTIPYIATATGNPNCLQCHKVASGAVLGAVSMTMSLDAMKSNALWTVAGIAGAVMAFALLLIVLVRRQLRPVSRTARAVESAVLRALNGDFKSQIKQQTHDEIGQIANDMNRLLTFLDDGLTRIGNNVARLTERTPNPGENQLTATIEMVEGLTRAAHFKQAIEEDETKQEIYQRLATTLKNDFALGEFSIYEINGNKLDSVMVDGEAGGNCRWCDPQIFVRPEACRVRRTGHPVDGLSQPDICYSFRPDDSDGVVRRHVCIPIIQSGAVGSIVQLIGRTDTPDTLRSKLPLVNVYLRETAPVLETKRLMDSLRESTLRDAMTGLNNRRFLEEYVETLVAGVQRKNGQVSILMLDLDYFKMVNDTYGHDAGDTLLKALSKVLRQAVRASDLVIRYGGEEFMIVLLDSDTEHALTVAENIRMAVEKLKVQINGAVLQKTISIGIAGYPADSDTFWQTVKFADVALYRAKHEGRNRVVRFSPEMWDENAAY